MTGFNFKGIIAILGTLEGVVFAGVLSIFFSKAMGLTGYTTMINTLILAYIGGSLFTIMLLTIQQKDFPNIRILNFEFVGVEFLRAFGGSMGILIVVPLTSFLASKIHMKEKEVF